eukprot:309925-Prorocentrum_minimum.AAC.1
MEGFISVSTVGTRIPLVPYTVGTVGSSYNGPPSKDPAAVAKNSRKRLQYRHPYSKYPYSKSTLT